MNKYKELESFIVDEEHFVFIERGNDEEGYFYRVLFNTRELVSALVYQGMSPTRAWTIFEKYKNYLDY